MRTMLVTGAARGLGARLVERAVAEGYRVVAVDPAFGADELRGATSGTVRLSGSITDPAFVDGLFGRLRHVGVESVDVVLNNAGIVRFGPLVDLEMDAFRSVVDVNLVGTFAVARAAAREWRSTNRSGSIVNITSINGVAAGPNSGAYGATKAAVALLTSQMAIEWGPLGIRVNAVAPGLIDAGMSEPIYADHDTRRARESRVPLGRLGTSDDIASAILFLASESASYITGQTLVVDGGVVGSVIASLPRPASVDSVGHPSPDR